MTSKTNYVTDRIDASGLIHFHGDGQPVNFNVVDSLNCDSSHDAPLTLTALAAANGILTDGLDTGIGATRRIEVIGIDSGVFVKGRNKGTYTQEDTTHESSIIKIKLNTTNATWEQAAEWHGILDILTGPITGTFTVNMPPFSMMEYSSLELYVTQDGATYAESTARGFEVSLAGPSAADELFSNNESDGTDVVVEVASTTGFYVGNQVFVSDSVSSEWTRITAIVTDTSITVDLTNSYTTANGAQFDIFDFIRTVPTEPIQRGLFRAKVFKTGVNSGIQLQIPVPQQTDPTADFNVVLQYISSANNAGLAMLSKWRVQYIYGTPGEDMPISIQFGKLAYADITPPALKANGIGTLVVITAADHQGKNLLAMEVVRLGADAGDTYTGDLKLAANIGSMPWQSLGYES